MKSLLNWMAAAASLAGLFFTLRPASGALSPLQLNFVILLILVFGFAAFRDIREERRRAAKSYKTSAEVDDYMFAMLKNNGRCEICSRDASWIENTRIYKLLETKAKKGELTFIVHKSTDKLDALEALGAEVIVYGLLGFDPVTRFTVVNSGNHSSAYVAIGRRRLNGPHTIEELDSSHPTYSVAVDLIRSIRVAYVQSQKN